MYSFRTSYINELKPNIMILLNYIIFALTYNLLYFILEYIGNKIFNNFSWLILYYTYKINIKYNLY